METITMKTTVAFIVEECYSCGVAFGITETTYRHAKDKGTTFYCPNGHGQVYTETKEKEIEKLKKELKQAQDDKKWWSQRAEENAAEGERIQKQLSATKSQLTKTKNRIAKGICPCCKRQFVDLQKHMKGQHPNYEKDEET